MEEPNRNIEKDSHKSEGGKEESKVWPKMGINGGSNKEKEE